jgi:hypothetical protein
MSSSPQDTNMTRQMLIQELQDTFERIAEIIWANDSEAANSQRRFNFQSASLLIRAEPSAHSVAQLSAPGLLVFLRPDKEPFLGVMGRIDFRRGGAMELRALLARLQKGATPPQLDRQAVWPGRP